ncbi:hypothetical protein ZHAS_00013996 [Anopheles sinensis]|uniref:Uncharacterized protein n=1 Tax=Anopheles sinensis TaxID=74873 RepID=A0A084W732_ANOSI|nr:hypothetical protein ZHAS_00013996 [Anopheles sinensis]
MYKKSDSFPILSSPDLYQNRSIHLTVATALVRSPPFHWLKTPCLGEMSFRRWKSGRRPRSIDLPDMGRWAIRSPESSSVVIAATMHHAKGGVSFRQIDFRKPQTRTRCQPWIAK